MDQLPEKDAPQTPPEPQALETEAPTPIHPDEAPQSEPEQSTEPSPVVAEGASSQGVPPAPETSAGGEQTAGADAEVAAPAVKPREAPARPARPTGPRMAELRPGMVVEGTVTRVEKYGAFVNLGLVERRDGLIHISELAPNRIRRVEDVVQTGSPVRARVVSVDMGRGRIALSLNDVDAETATEASAGPSEPALTAMAMAFQQAESKQREREEREQEEVRGGEVGSKKRREQEDLMRKLRSSNGQ